MVKENKIAAGIGGTERKMERVGTKIRGVEDLGDHDFLRQPTGFPYDDPFDFMAGKRADDGVPAHLWRIHDKLYDLHKFNHPGGKRWIHLTKGTDITELFETHHLDADRVNKMIQFMEVEHEPLPPRNSPFTFEPDGFYCTLRRRICEAHGGEARKKGESNVASLGASTKAKVYADIMLGTLTTPHPNPNLNPSPRYQP
jgi:hypothetical protein